MLRVRLSKAISFDMHSREVLDDGLRVWLGGESGSGKSNAAMLIVTQVVQQGGQVVVLDAHGEYGALWEQAPGRLVRVGYGGEPVSDASVEWLLHVLREGKSLVLDLSHWTDLYPQVLDSFMLEFLRGLYELRRQTPRQTLLLVEECQNIAPQVQMSGQAENIRTFLSIVTGGRKFGLNFILASQRQSLVDSNVIGGCNVRVFLRVSETRDWKRVRAYLPPKMQVTFNTDARTDINKFASGEALLVSRWFPHARVRLMEAEVPLRKPTLLEAVVD